MTVCCQTMPSPQSIALKYDAGVSDTAERMQQTFKESVEHYLKPRLDQMESEIAEVMVDSRDVSVPVDRATALEALRFASLLPGSAPLPEVSPDPDGEISFDWFGPLGKMFSVSVNKSGQLSYAGWFGEDRRIHGTERMVNGVPEEIVRGIQRATR